MNELVTTKQDELLTQAQMAERLGVSVATVSRRIEALGLTPAVEKANLGKSKGWQPALYSLEQFSICKQQQVKIEDEKQRAIKKASDLTKPMVKQHILKEYVQHLDEDDSLESAEEVLANAAGFIAMFVKKADRFRQECLEKDKKIALLEDDNRRLTHELENVNVLLDLSASYASVKKMEAKNNEQYNWRLLKGWAIEHQPEYTTALMGKVPDQNYG